MADLKIFDDGEWKESAEAHQHMLTEHVQGKRTPSEMLEHREEVQRIIHVTQMLSDTLGLEGNEDNNGPGKELMANPKWKKTYHQELFDRLMEMEKILDENKIGYAERNIALREYIEAVAEDFVSGKHIQKAKFNEKIFDPEEGELTGETLLKQVNNAMRAKELQKKSANRREGKSDSSWDLGAA